MPKLILLICLAAIASCATVHAGDEPYVILISIDGLGADARDRTATPTLDFFAENGLVADRMQPVFPTLTFPNHFSIATGLYPAEHGIVANKFPNEARDDWYALYDRDQVKDGRWYRGDPLWVVAENNGMIAASYYFVGTEADVGGVRPSIYYDFDPTVPGEDRVDEVLRWLSLPDAERPQMMTLYFEDVDTASHRFGVDADGTLAAIRRVDGYLARLLAGVRTRSVAEQVTFVIVSDHGQSDVLSDAEPFIAGPLIDRPEATIVEGGSYLNVFDATLSDEEADRLCDVIDAAWESGACYTQRTAPASWRMTDDPRFPELTLVPDLGHKVVTSAEVAARQPSIGYHGWAPEVASMSATFIAMGPRIPKGSRVDAIHVVDVYPFVLDILRLPAPRVIPEQQKKLTRFLKDDTVSAR